MSTAQQVPNVFNRMTNQNAEMSVKMLAADRTLNVYRLTMSLFANAYRVMEAKQPMLLLAADHYQSHAVHQPIAQLMLTVMEEFANRPVR